MDPKGLIISRYKSYGCVDGRKPVSEKFDSPWIVSLGTLFWFGKEL